MNVKDYIASGILENYVLGNVSDLERREVECMAGIYPEIREELQKLSESVNAYLETYETTPPEGLKQKVLGGLESLARKEQDGKVVEMKSTGSIGWKYAVAASVALLIALGISLFNISTRVDSLNDQLSDLEVENEELISLNEGSNTLIERLKETNNTYYQVLKDPNNKVVHMHEAEGKPDALTLVYWNPSSQEVFVQVDHMHIPSEELQYQLWAIVDGKAIDAGVFEVGPDSTDLQKMKPTKEADAFVVTLEKRGGVPVAEGEIYALGNT